jgi:hypothetical protein
MRSLCYGPVIRDSRGRAEVRPEFKHFLRNWLAMKPGHDQAVACGFDGPLVTIIARSFGEGFIDGHAEEARMVLIHLGTRKFRPPDEPMEARIASLTDPDRLEGLIDRALDVASWDEVLADSPNEPE